jgi:hypothetical protein
VGGSAGEVRTHVQKELGTPVVRDAGEVIAIGEVIASAPGAVSVGGDVTGRVITDVTSAEMLNNLDQA